MAELWTAFIEDYGNEIHQWPLSLTLELFWHYCQDGSMGVYDFMDKKHPSRAKKPLIQRTRGNMPGQDDIEP